MYTVQYVPGRHLTPSADALSRMPIPAEEAYLQEEQAAEEEMIALLTDVQRADSMLTEQDVCTASAVDPELQQDNVPQFLSKDFAAYLAARGVKHIKSSVYWPQGNYRGAVQQDLQVVDHKPPISIAHRRSTQEPGAVSSYSPRDNGEDAVRAPAWTTHEAEPACHSAVNTGGRTSDVSCPTPSADQQEVLQPPSRSGDARHRRGRLYVCVRRPRQRTKTWAVSPPYLRSSRICRHWAWRGYIDRGNA